MTQMFTPLLTERSDRILCCYVNATSNIQLARIANIPNWYFERVVFPSQRLLFEALPEAQLEIHTSVTSSEIQSDRMLCKYLRVKAPHLTVHIPSHPTE